MTESAVEVRGLIKTFGRFTAVNDIGFSVERGSIFGLLGANGAGKTTTIRILCGLLAATSGTVRLAGIDVTARPEEAKKRIGYMSQRFSLYRDLTADENLEFFGGLYGSAAAATASSRKKAFGEVGLEGMEGILAGELPGGIAQRLALACAVSHDPAVLFLDEPTAGVDPSSRRMFWDLIHAAARRGTTVVITTHYLDEAEYCDRIVLMHDGRIAAEGSPGELKSGVVDGAVLEISGPGVMVLEKRFAGETWVAETALFGDAVHVQTAAGVGEAEAKERVMRLAGEEGIGKPDVEAIVPSLEDVFLRVIDRAENAVAEDHRAEGGERAEGREGRHEG